MKVGGPFYDFVREQIAKWFREQGRECFLVPEGLLTEWGLIGPSHCQAWSLAENEWQRLKKLKQVDLRWLVMKAKNEELQGSRL